MSQNHFLFFTIFKLSLSFHFVNYRFKFLTSQALCIALDFHYLGYSSKYSMRYAVLVASLMGIQAQVLKKKNKVHDLNHCTYTHFPFGFTAKITRLFHFQAIKRNLFGFHQRPLIQILGSETISSSIPPNLVWKFFSKNHLFSKLFPSFSPYAQTLQEISKKLLI